MRVLFMCTANSCRSILSEALFNHLAPEGFEAVSSGSFPKGQVLPRSLATLQRAGISVQGLSSKGNDAFEGSPPDIVITVCDKAAGEACPVWPGQPMTAHWGIEDPAALSGSDIQKEAAFADAFRYLRNRISVFTALPLRSLDTVALGTKLREIGQLAGSTTRRPDVA